MNYTYISCNNLSNEYITQIENFSNSSGYIPYYETYERNFPLGIDTYHFFLCDNTIISFIGLMPLDDAIEITGYTLPKYQHKGLFTMLLNTVMSKLSRLNIKAYSSEYLNYSFVNNTFDHSDLMMVLDMNDNRILSQLNSAATNVSNQYDILENSYEIENDSELFDTEYIYTISDQDNTYSLLKLTISGDTACLHHVMTRHQFRNMGYGKGLLIGALNMFSEVFSGKIILHVNGDNTPAIHLYEAVGFNIIEKIDTYSVTFSAS